MVFDLQNILILFVVLANFIIALLVFIRNPKNKINITFVFLPLSTIMWSVSMIMYRSAPSVGNSIAWAQLLYASASTIAISYLIFCIVFLKIKINKFVYTLIFIPFLFIFLSSLIPNLIIKDVIFQYSGEKIIIFGYIYYFYNVYIPLYSSIGFILLLTQYVKISGIKKNQIRIIFYGTFLSGCLAMITNLLLPTLGYFELNWAAQVFFIIYVSSIAYAIARYRLMDIKLIIARTIVFSLFVVILIAIYAVLSVIIGTYFESLLGIKSNMIIGITIAVLVVIGYQPSRNFIEKTTNKFLFKKSYDPDQLLSHISDVTSSILNLHQLLASISNILNEAFHCDKIGVALLDKKHRLYLAHQQGFDPAVMEKFAAGKEQILPLYFQEGREIQVIDELKTRYEAGEYQPKSVELLESLYKMDIGLVIPLFVKETLIGLYVMGNKKSGDPYSHQDLNIIKIISGQSAIAIENAILYDELKDYNLKLDDEVKRKTAELRKANEELKQLDEAKSEFISIASHQLRTPLTIIKGYASMMLEGSFGAVPGGIKNYLGKIFEANERLIKLVENLLDISRIESGRQEYDWSKGRLEDIAATVVENLKNSAHAKGLKMVFHKPKKPTPPVTLDAGKIHEIMMNFVDNAIKYTKAGRIDVSVDVVDKNWVRFCVKDTGMGILPEIKPVLFQKFSRGKGSFTLHTEGLGLGLYVAKMLLDTHQGKIWADSEGAGKGSAFCFSLPVVNDKIFTAKAGKVSSGKK